MGARLAGLTVVGVVVALVGVGTPVGYFLFVYGCGQKEDRLMEALEQDLVLDGGPAGAGGSEPYKGCDDDDLWVYAGSNHPYEGTKQTALTHFREAARKNGWQPYGDSGTGSGPDCFTKSIGGTTAYFTVEGPSDGVVTAEIIADHAGTDWC